MMLRKGKNIIFFIILLVFFISIMSSSFSSAPPANGYDWERMPKSEKIAYCEILIYGMVGIGNPKYNSQQINAAAKYFTGRINFYYSQHSGNLSIEKAASWAWPETKNLLDSL
ncbi:hypothetical protein [Desulfatibacillum alkenivorans]|jgi:hypothetical protein|uniref:hypothetical protein n=1 Tax=Desulfatibacillum alkenivorans TaxID=259354 RepID=UPI00111496AD|nr:hypothetical protein [Desulfatibacillum alkenivorans]